LEIDAVERSYARWAPIYDRTFGALTREGRRAAVEYINGLGRPCVLEVGVGTGLALPHYTAQCDVVGVDFSPEMLAKAEDRIGRLNLAQVRSLHRMDARDLDFPDDHFDAVAAMHMISVVPEPERVLAEIHRVLKPGGKLVISNHFARDRGAMATVEQWLAPFANRIGWHSDFPVATVTGVPGFRLIEKRPLPPLGIMTLLVLEKRSQGDDSSPARGPGMASHPRAE
jgi:phosphatidylethanolamine/phosphatidyl-N-methylethanolamine N-methyltransferase